MGSAASIPQQIQQRPSVPSPSRSFVIWALSVRDVRTCVTTRINTQRNILRLISEFSAVPEKKTVKNYRRLKTLAKGFYGVVDLVYKRKTQERFVMKISKLDFFHKDEYTRPIIEAHCLGNLHHPNLMALEEFFFEGKYAITIVEYCDAGNLQDRIKKAKLKNRQFHELRVMDWCIQLIFALEYLHDNKLMHGNITARNIHIIHGNKMIKLASPDIQSEQKRRKSLHMCIDPDVFRDSDLAPEHLQGKKYSFATDVWFLGLVLGKTMLLHHPFQPKDLFDLMRKVTHNDRPPIPDVYSSNIRGLVDLLLTVDCTERPSVKDVRRHGYVQDHLEGFIERYGKEKEQSLKELAEVAKQKSLLEIAKQKSLLEDGK